MPPLLQLTVSSTRTWQRRRSLPHQTLLVGRCWGQQQRLCSSSSSENQEEDGLQQSQDQEQQQNQPSNHVTAPNTGRCRRFLPDEPTWSWKEYWQDCQQQNPTKQLDDAEIQRLARRTLLFPVPPGIKEDLQQMMQFLEQVKDTSADAAQEEEEDLDDVAIYDLPRGITSAPLRPKQQNEEGEVDQDAASAQAVYQSFLQPNTTRIGGRHEYFSITTGSVRVVDDAAKKDDKGE